MTIAALLLALAGTAPPASASGASSAEQAAQIVKRQVGGRILGVRAQGNRYLVKVMTAGGKVRVVAVPAR